MMAVHNVVLADHLIDIDHRKVIVRIRLTKPRKAFLKMAASGSEAAVEIAGSAHAPHDRPQRDIRHPDLDLADRSILAPVVVERAESASRPMGDPGHQTSGNPAVSSGTGSIGWEQPGRDSVVHVCTMRRATPEVCQREDPRCVAFANLPPRLQRPR
jgi:hypothetical protein